MHVRIASCALRSPFVGRNSAKLRRSPFTEYCRAGNVTFRPPSRRSHTAKPINFSPLSGPASLSKITSASASFPAGVACSFGMIFTDTDSPVTLDMVDLQEHRGCQTDGVGEVRAGRRDAGERGWDARPRGTCELTGYRTRTTFCMLCQ